MKYEEQIKLFCGLRVRLAVCLVCVAIGLLRNSFIKWSEEMNSMFFDWAFARLKEPSTWAGLVGLVSSLGVVLNPAQTQAIIQLGVAFASAIMVLMPEAGNKK